LLQEATGIIGRTIGKDESAMFMESRITAKGFADGSNIEESLGLIYRQDSAKTKKVLSR
jgi:hypothetical protein